MAAMLMRSCSAVDPPLWDPNTPLILLSRSSVAHMKYILPLALLVTIWTGPSPAKPNHKSIEDQLMKLDPQTRAEQRCNSRVSGITNREHKGFNADEVVAYAFADSAL